MKKGICLLLIVCMAVAMSMPACAEVHSDSTLAVGVITRIFQDMLIDLDADGDQEKIGFEIRKDAEGYDIGYRLSVDDVSVEGEGWSMNEALYALRLNQWNTLLLVSDYGPSDDYETSFYLYENDTLKYVGSIYALPDSMVVEDEIITAPIRGNLLYTWFHDADFGLANYRGENGETDACIYQIPRYLYTMGLMAKLKVDVPLSASMTNAETVCTLKDGSFVVLCATDDVEWVYIQSADRTEAGWMRVGGKYGMECIVGEERMYSWDVFDGLLFAD